ncbi:hypothetical protein D9757_000449 [Collybiopsis confluens]|uniref:NAD(P)-binding protein n=1 Tax=Collybiopsis confluens TaxID=2823264 RepID=A0A8H5MGV2_9AGAR|nr:hypothetical protein D9757_006495 [Collybiopsis confluens]KAF5393276.1 hypothetical protein D9757_000449 [Collybiopsis confluens]
MSNYSSTERPAFDMSARVALVTGGGTGIGLCMATGLARNGAKVYITGRRVDVLEKAANSIQCSGLGSLVPLQMDVTDEESINKGVQVVTRAEGRLDILINNAGATIPSSQPDFVAKGMEYYSQGKLPYELETFEGWSQLFRLNTAAPFFVTTAFLDLLTKGANTGGRQTSIVINISSIAASMRTAYPANSLSYGLTKAAVEQITTFMAADLARRKIPVRVVALAPGPFPSEILEKLGNIEDLATQAPANHLSPGPLLRIGLPEEIAMSANLLVANEYVNGVILTIDGGFKLVNL